MKKKPINIVLALAFIAVWGLVIYRIVGNDTPEVAMPVAALELAPASSSTELPDSFALLADYPDPFLKGKSRRRRSSGSNSRSNGASNPSSRTPRPQTPRETVVADTATVQPWPKVAYVGIISNEKRGQVVALLNLDETERVVTAGDSLQGLYVKSVSADSIYLVRGDQQRGLALRK